MPCFLPCHSFVSHAPRQKSAKKSLLCFLPSRPTRQFPANRWRRSSGPADALTHSMQLVPNQLPSETPLIASMEANERTAPVDTSDSRFVLKGGTAMSGTSRWLFIGALIGAMLLSVGGTVFTHYRGKNGQ